MNYLDGMKIAICQMNSVPLDPIANATYACEQIQKAAANGAHLIIFPELCIHDYLNGDAIESKDLVTDIQIANLMVEKATAVGIIAIFGSVITGENHGEDGRTRKYNSGIVAQNGARVGFTVKTLQPNYRMFADDRHYFSARKIAEERMQAHRARGTFSDVLAMINEPIAVQTEFGVIKFGVILCEDMWKDDYDLNPAVLLAESGADVIINLSASPWTWRKNEKRHRVVRGLFSERRSVPFFYVNKTGFNQQGKSCYPFDGSSAIYDEQGEVIFEVPAYFEGLSYFTYAEQPAILQHSDNNHDSEELYQALCCTCKGMLKTIPEDFKILVGLSGGIDSAVVAALFTAVAGADRVVAVNMPYKSMNSIDTKSDAAQIASNLGIEYLVRPIDAVVDAMISGDPDFDPKDTVNFGNLQALARMMELNKLSKSKRYKGVFTCNSNKVEAAFGYGTLYADIAGFFAPLLDLVKREVYQIGAYENSLQSDREIIPASVFNRPPSAELETAQRDPFDYGSLTANGYHDQMVRALTEFRWDWSDFLERWIKGSLERELQLPKDHLQQLFPTAKAFVEDLELQRKRYDLGFFKRLQAPPSPITSKRGFGDDLRESLHHPAASQRYTRLRSYLINF